jgi:hypothetical protein
MRPREVVVLTFKKTILLAALTVIALLAGCVGSGNPEFTVDAAADAEEESLEQGREDAEMEDTPPPAPPEPVDVNVSFTGETGTFLCVITPEGPECQGTFSDSSMHRLEYEGTPISLEGEVTWELESPTAQQLRVAVFAVDENGDFDYQNPVDAARGGSPLTFRFDLFDVAGEDLVLDVSSVQEAGPVVGSMAQEFTVEAVFTYQPDA